MRKLAATGLKKQFKGRYVVNDVSLSINSGEVVGLLGPNGAGKTTCFYIIVGLIRPDGGNLMLDDQDIMSLPMHKRAKLGVGYLPQEPSIFRKLTVEQNIMAILETRKELSGEQRQHRLEQLMQDLHITDRRYRSEEHTSELQSH